MNTQKSPVKPRILVAPLDWGLGHATRCIPLIHTLLNNGATVLLAGDGKIETVLKTEFPDLRFIPLPGYRVQYGKSRAGTFLALFRQLPRLLRAIKQENAWLQAIVDTHHIDAVVSDNRYGLHHPRIYTVFMTHQLLVKTGLPATDALLQKRLYRFIGRFNACWVPDVEAPPNLAGALAHPKGLPRVPVTYIGPVSRFVPGAPVLTPYLLVLLSGPEPQRTLLEEMVLQQVKLFQNPIFIVRGLPGTAGLPPVPYHVSIVNHLPTATLQKAIDSAQYVISRCGYSTVMDMMLLKKRCIFIPTPGQTEQEYLAQHLMQRNAALALSQHKFDLKKAIGLADTFPFQFPDIEKTGALQKAVVQLLQQVCGFEKVEGPPVA